MYIDNPNQSVVITGTTATTISAPTSTGGVFMIKQATAVSITSSSSFIGFGPGSYGTFMYSDHPSTTFVLTL